MSDADRLDAIDKKLEWLRDRLDAQLNSEQYEMGFARVHQLAIHKLVSVLPLSREIGIDLRHRLTEYEAQVVAEAKTEAFLQGVQDAHSSLNRVLEARLSDTDSEKA
jgi:hypothetical protein